MKDTNSNQRVLEILRMIIERPAHHTVKMLSMTFNVSSRTIQNDLNDIENAGFLIDSDSKHRYFLVPEKLSEQLEELMVLTTKEKDLIYESLAYVDTTDTVKKRISAKLENLTQIPGVGNTYFSNHYLSKVSQLNAAVKNQTRVILKDYRSTNSNTRKDRLIEPFHISVEDDIIHSFDCHEKAVRHFRMSRIERIEVLDEPWEYTASHYIAATDIFRITNKKQETIHIRMMIGGVNELLERYPLSKAYLTLYDETSYDLRCKVNADFYGLSNFLMGYAHYIIEIIESPALLAHMKEKKEKLIF